MAEKLITTVRLQELHESARYANSHGNGQVSLAAAELLELLPELPEEHKKLSTQELLAKELQEKEAEKKAAEPAEVAAPAGAPLVDTPTLSQEDIDAQVKWDKEHPTQEEQERAKAETAKH